MSPLQTTMLGSGLFFAATKLMTSILETVADEDIIGTNFAVMLTILCTISWAGYFAALCRDHVIASNDARIDRLEATLLKQIPGYGELCTDDGRIDAAREYARTNGSPVLAGQRGRFNVVD